MSTHRDLVDGPVTAVMDHRVHPVAVSASLGEALEVMVRADLRHLVVLDAGGRCLGVLGDRAVAAAWASDPAALSAIQVARLLDPHPAVVARTATVGEVVRTMHGVDAVAVIDGSGAPVGMVTGRDLLTLMADRVHVGQRDAVVRASRPEGGHDPGVPARRPRGGQGRPA